MQCCRTDNLARYNRQTPEKREAHRLSARKSALKKSYGITWDQYIGMFEAQNGECAICTHPVHPMHENRYLVGCVDHCHTTGKVRGILCFDCNVGLGKFFDKTASLRAAIAYLETNQ
ncbi:recombination endonuclease VII [Pseudomonas phage PSV6]|nr:recombination endonuclease VII [Pseudomonas phage PSV6]